MTIFYSGRKLAERDFTWVFYKGPYGRIFSDVTYFKSRLQILISHGEGMIGKIFLFNDNINCSDKHHMRTTPK